MSTRKPRATKSKEPKSQSKPLLQLDPDRWEEIGAIGVIILAALTALGAFNLSGGLILDTWTQLLRGLLGWGVYFAPFLLLGLGIWMIFDALDKTWNIGWERPIGLGLMYLLLLAVFHWFGAPANPVQQPSATPINGVNGGILGWVIASALIGSFGEIGAGVAMLAGFSIALIMFFNVSLPELVRRVFYLAHILRHLPTEINKFRTRSNEPKVSPAKSFRTGEPAPTQSRVASPTPARAPARIEPTQSIVPPIQTDLDDEEDEETAVPALPPIAPGARVIGASPPVVPVIQREWALPDYTTILEDSVELEINEQEIRERYHKIEETLAHFGVPAKVIEVNQGPTITQFGVEPGFIDQKGADGKLNRVKVKVSRISALQHDLELALAAAPIRIEAPVPGKSIVGIEVPNPKIALVSLRGVMDSDAFSKIKTKLPLALGQDVSGQAVSADLTKMPHLLIAGATGSGKSVCVNAVIACLLCTKTPAQVQFIMVDPKRVELVNFNGIPHLREPVVVEMDRAVNTLQNVVAEMDRRFKLFAKIPVDPNAIPAPNANAEAKSARNIEIYNQMIEGNRNAEKLPYLIVIVDELADLMMVEPQEVERAITRLAQMARATGIHLILATQRPSVDVVTGLIKANFPSRISFAVTSQIDSRVVLDTPGAEKLLGHGDMLYMASDASQLTRLQGCFVSDRELDKLVTYWKNMSPPPLETLATTAEGAEADYLQETLWGGAVPLKKEAHAEDDLLPDAIKTVQQFHKASVSLLQRKLRIGYSRAARLIELLEEKGIVGPDEGPTKGRAVRATPPPLLTPPVEPKPAKPIAPSSPTAPRQFEQAKPDDEFADWTDEDWDDLDKE